MCEIQVMCRVWPQKTPTESNKSTVTPYLPIPLKGTTLDKKRRERKYHAVACHVEYYAPTFNISRRGSCCSCHCIVIVVVVVVVDADCVCCRLNLYYGKINVLAAGLFQMFK